MMAALGAVVQHYVKFPGFDSVPTGLAASITAPGSYGFVALFAVAGILELGAWTESPDKEPARSRSVASCQSHKKTNTTSTKKTRRKKQQIQNTGAGQLRRPRWLQPVQPGRPPCKASHSMPQIPLIFQVGPGRCCVCRRAARCMLYIL